MLIPISWPGIGEPIPRETIRAVRKAYDGILIVGGGITTDEAGAKAAKGGADILVVGNWLQSPGFEGILRRIVKTLKR